MPDLLMCQCGDAATINVRHGLEDHPTCGDCAAWWGEHRHGPLLSLEHYAEQERAFAEQHRLTERILAGEVDL